MLEYVTFVLLMVCLSGVLFLCVLVLVTEGVDAAFQPVSSEKVSVVLGKGRE